MLLFVIHSYLSWYASAERKWRYWRAIMITKCLRNNRRCKFDKLALSWDDFWDAAETSARLSAQRRLHALNKSVSNQGSSLRNITHQRSYVAFKRQTFTEWFHFFKTLPFFSLVQALVYFRCNNLKQISLD